jgi:hypothetical protein
MASAIAKQRGAVIAAISRGYAAAIAELQK